MRRKVQLSPARHCGASTTVGSYSPRRGAAQAPSASAPPAARKALRSMALPDRPPRARSRSRGDAGSGRSDVVALRELDAVVAKDVVRRGDVEIEVRQRVSEQVLHAGEVDLARAELEMDLLVLGAFELRRGDALDEVDGLRDTRLELGEGLLGVLVL